MRIEGFLAAVLLTSAPALAQQPPATLEPAPPPAAVDPRPDGRTIGIGVGWAFPRSILEPNTASVRFRLGRLTLEPNVRLGGQSSTTEQNGSVLLPNQDPTETEDRDVDSGFETSVGANVRYAAASRGPVDFLLIVGANVGFNRQTEDENLHLEDQVDRQTTSTFSAGLSWGLGLEWFLGKMVSLSADAQNPMFSFRTTNVHTDREQPLLGDKVITTNDSRTSAVEGALTFRPTVRVMLHLYF